MATTSFVSGFDDDDVGIHKNMDDPVEEFLTAAEDGDLEKVNQMIAEATEKSDDERHRLLGMQDEDGYTALHRSCYNNHLDVAKALVNAGSPILLTNDAWSPLHTAACWGNADIVGFLLSTGKVDMNATTNGGLTALHLAIKSMKEDKDAVLLTVRYLLAVPGVNPSIRSNGGDTPFDLAKRISRDMMNLLEWHLKRL